MKTLESLRDAIAQLQAYRFVTPPPGKAIRQWFCPPMDEGMTVINRDAALAVIDALTVVMPHGEAISDAAVEQRARELLAAQYDAVDQRAAARIRSPGGLQQVHEIRARNAIAAALREAPPLPPQGAAVTDEVKAWMIPSIMRFPGTDLHGRVAWGVSQLGDAPDVTDRFGVTHTKQPLYATPQPATPAVDWPHVANEWADAATNGPCYVEHLRDGTMTYGEVLASMRCDFDHCHAVKAAMLADSPPAVPAQAAGSEGNNSQAGANP